MLWLELVGEAGVGQVPIGAEVGGQTPVPAKLLAGEERLWLDFVPLGKERIAVY